MKKLHYKKFSIAAISLCFTALLPALAQGDIMVYPAKGRRARTAPGRSRLRARRRSCSKA